MAHKVPSDEAPRATVRNPDLFGEDLVPLAWEAAGVGLAALVNDRVAAPIARQVVPGISGSMGKLVDALTTAGAGWAAGEVASMVSRPIGNRIRRGGVLLGVARAISAFVPGFSISAQFPNLPVPAIGAQALPAANGSGNGKVVQLPTAATAPVARLGVGSTGL